MAHRPEDTYIGAWFAPEQVAQVERLIQARGLSRAELLRQLVADAAKWLTPGNHTQQEPTHDHA